MTDERDARPNREQATYWNEQAGPKWVAMGRDLDAQLEPFGVALASKLALSAGERVLDVGCGAGATSLMLAERVRPGDVVGADISSTLLARARERAAAAVAAPANVRFELADAQVFAFERASFDAVFSRFGVMFFADPVAAFRNLRSALKPRGKLGFVCWRPMRENLAFVLPIEAALPFLTEPPAPSEPDAPGPFAFADDGRIRAILEAAGFVEIAIAPHDAPMLYAGGSDIDAAVDLAFHIGPLGRALAKVPESAMASTRASVRAAVRAALAPYHGPAGVTLPSATWIVTARAPAV